MVFRFLIQEKKALDEMKQFQTSMLKHICQCTICYEAWPISTMAKEKQMYVCARCVRDKGNPKKFSAEIIWCHRQSLMNCRI